MTDMTNEGLQRFLEKYGSTLPSKEAEIEDKVMHPSGASTSKAPRFDLLPLDSILGVAARFELGSIKHGEFNWKKGLGDRSYAIERANHVIHHAFKLIAKLRGDLPQDGDNDAAAIAWGGLFLQEAVKALSAEPKKEA
jgi:hypothetical protein